MLYLLWRACIALIRYFPLLAPGIEGSSRPEANPYGPTVAPEEAPEAITQAVASLPPEQMFELMKQMKVINSLKLLSRLLVTGNYYFGKEMFPFENF